MVRLFGVVALFLVSVPAFAQWDLRSDSSRLSFVSIKNNIIAETHRFTMLNGEVNTDGGFALSIPLESVETGIDIRNKRMREVFFQIAEFPSATVRGSVDPDVFKNLKKGQRVNTTLTAELSLHGVSQEVEADVLVTRLDADQVSVQTRSPILIVPEDFNLADGVRTLMELAGLDSITEVVPVTFDLIFTHDESDT